MDGAFLSSWRSSRLSSYLLLFPLKPFPFDLQILTTKKQMS